MTIRAVREVGAISIELEKMLIQCESQNTTSAYDVFKKWNSLFANRPAFDFKIFKSVQKNYRAIQAEIKAALESVEDKDFAGAGSALARMESYIVEFTS